MSDDPHADEPDLGFGDPWQPDVRTFLASTAFMRSVLTFHGLSAATVASGKGKGDQVQGSLVLRFKGKWNHGAQDVVSVLIHPAVARDLAQNLAEGADAAERDVERWKREHGGRP